MQVIKCKNTNSPKINIVIPVKKNGCYKTTLNSLNKQTLQDFNVYIVFDDNKKGANYTRNVGFSIIEKKAKYVLFSDDDIFWKNDALESMYDFLEEKKHLSYCYGSYEMANKTYCTEHFTENKMRTSNLASTMSLIRTDDFPFFDNDIQRLQDWDLWLCMLNEGKIGDFIGKTIFSTKKRKGISYRSKIDYIEAKRIISKKWGLNLFNEEMEYVGEQSQNNSFDCYIARISKDNPFEAVKKMVLDRYNNGENAVVILGYNRDCNMRELRKMFPGKKIIIYQLEQLYENKSDWYDSNAKTGIIAKRTKHIRNMLSQCDEIWDYDLDNIEFLKSEGFEAKHRPLIYSDAVVREKPDNTKKDIDVLFYGAINDSRADYLDAISDNFNNICIIAPNEHKNKYKDRKFAKHIQSPVYNEKLFNDYIFRSKIVLNLHYYDSNLQEQVRLFELIANNVIVVSEHSKRNYYKGLLHEFYNEYDMIKIISTILSDINISEKFKKETENIEYRCDSVVPHTIYNNLHFAKPSVVPDNIDMTNCEDGINVYWHICIIDKDSIDIIYEQFNLLCSSGIIKQKNINIYYSVVGKVNLLPFYIKDNKDLNCVYSNKNMDIAEIPMLEHIRNDALKSEFDYCLYFHTKGATASLQGKNKDIMDSWRHYMQYFLVRKWRQNVNLLKQYDATGASLILKQDWYNDHYSGNFWWAKSEHIKTLCEVKDVNVKKRKSNDAYRYKAEMWLLSKECKCFNWADEKVSFSVLNESEYKL